MNSARAVICRTQIPSQDQQPKSWKHKDNSQSIATDPAYSPVTAVIQHYSGEHFGIFERLN